jgi:hypothetical protein
MRQPKYPLSISLLALTLALSPAAQAADDAKRACVEASSSGQIKRDEGKLIEAREQFALCVRDKCPSVVRTSCDQWLHEVEEQIPSIVVRVSDAAGEDLPDARASVDGTAITLDGKPLSLDPGRHVVVVEIPNDQHLEKKLLLAAGERARLVELSVPAGDSGPAPGIAPAASHSASSTRADKSSGVPTGAWLLGGLGVIGLGSFTFFALRASSDLHTLQNTCSPACTQAQTHPGRQSALIADISLGVGVLSLAGAVTWALLSGSQKTEAMLSAPHVDFQATAHGGAAVISGSY